MNVKKFTHNIINSIKIYFLDSIILIKNYYKLKNLLIISEKNTTVKYQNNTFNAKNLDTDENEIKNQQYSQTNLDHKIEAVLLQIDINQLTNFNLKEKSHNLYKLSSQLDRVYNFLKKESNLYIELLGSTKIDGFNELFGNTAFSPPCVEVCSRHKAYEMNSQLMHKQYCELVEKISADCLKIIYQQKSAAGNKNLYLLLITLNNSISNAKNFIDNYSKINIKEKILNLRGIYFSESQEHTKLKIENKNDETLAIETNQASETHKKVLALIFDNLMHSSNKKFFKKYTNIIVLIFFAFSFGSILYTSHLEYKNSLNFSKKALNFINTFCSSKNKNISNPVAFIEKYLMSDPSFIKYKPVILLLPQSRYINNTIRQLIKPTLSKLLYKKSKPWLESLLKNDMATTTDNFQNSRLLADHLITIYAYLSLAQPSKFWHLVNSWCYFSYGRKSFNLIPFCEYLMEWIEPHYEIIDKKLTDQPIQNFFKASLIQRIFSYYYAKSVLDQDQHIDFKMNTTLIDSSRSYSFLKIFTKKSSLNIPKTLSSYEKDMRFMGIKDEIKLIWNKNYLERFKNYLNDTSKNYWNERLRQIKITHFKSSYFVEELIDKIQAENSDFQLFTDFIKKIKINLDKNTLKQIEDYNFNPLAQWLLKINSLLEQINQGNFSKNKENSILREIIQQSPSSPFNEVISIAKNSPFPYSLWVTEIYQKIWHLFALNYLNQVSIKWQTQVLPLLNTDILSKYPFSESENEINLAEFENIFAPKKIIDRFMEKYFYQFLYLENNKLKVSNINGLSLPIPEKIVNFFDKIYHIKINYFNADSGNTSFQFSIRPIELSGNSRSLKLNLSGQSFSYSHGPQFNQLIHWPKENYSCLKLINFKNHNDEFRYNGIWSLFRLLSSSSNIITRNEGLQLHYETPEQYCDFITDLKIKPEYINLEILKKLKFPENFIN